MPWAPQEFRFLLPVLPLLLMYAGRALATVQPAWTNHSAPGAGWQRRCARRPHGLPFEVFLSGTSRISVLVGGAEVVTSSHLWEKVDLGLQPGGLPGRLRWVSLVLDEQPAFFLVFFFLPFWKLVPSF